ncbi:hypothetical protein [Pikeienuella sp. HZG-20]|uniref:hypothetical protein n=1 Tax=Paludibacillus litoralis TaxID=3133267 RepID=UPI0030EE4928
MFTTRIIVAIVVAGVAGAIANSIAIMLAFGAPLAPLILSFGREAVAIIVAALLAPIFVRMSGAQAWAAALAALTVIPSILAKTVFGATAPWLWVLGLNFVYALAATVVYVAATRGAART